MKPDTAQIQNIIQQALVEDIGSGDVTSEATVSENTPLKGKWIAKEDGIIAGLDVVRETFLMLDPHTDVVFPVSEGEWITNGSVIGHISGSGRALLSGERVALNFLQRMSGIATATHKLVEAVTGTGAHILDTRKTAPGLRFFDKWAVALGGGQNHRVGLYDMVIIKDNHISAAGSISSAVTRVREYDVKKRLIEVEVKNLRELEEAIDLNVHRIMLDNMPLEEMKQAVEICAGKIELEASGNITLETVREIAETGVDYISVGSITHSVKAMDISFLIY